MHPRGWKMNPAQQDLRKQGPRVSPPGRSNRVVPAAEPRASPMQGPAAPHQLKEPKPIGAEGSEKSRRLSPAVATEGVPGSQQAEPCRPGATQVRGSGEPEPDKSSGSKPVASSDPVPKPPGPVQSSRPRPTVPGGPGSVGSSRPRPVGSGDATLRGPGAPRLANSGVAQPSARSPNPGEPAGKPSVPPPSSGGSQPARGAQTVPEAKPPMTQPDRALPSSAESAGTGSGNLQPQRAAGELRDPDDEDFSVVFWFGDLNFRIETLDMHFVKLSIDGNKLSTLWEKDQLNMAKESETVLEGFHEGPLKFPPTYKFDVGTNTYDTRILWKIKPFESAVPSRTPPLKRSSVAQLTSGVTVTQHSYRSHMEYLTSDHKPVSAIFTLRFPYKVDLPLVQFYVEDEWTKVSDAIVKFRMAASFPRSSWDWIGLYKVGFRHHKDYVGYVWAKQEDSDSMKQQCQVAFGEETLPKGSGEYILGYYSNNMSTIVGVTEPFQIMLPSSLPSSSPSDSSDYSSEDDSTLVLLRPKSRSPSPGKAKQRGRRSRSRSPALPKLQALNLRPHSREKGKDRSPSPRVGHRAKRERLVCEPDESPSSSAPHPHTCASPGTPGIEVSAPEALGEKKPQENALSGGKTSGESKAAGL
ncbi:Phosphatidylinositol 4,5-bisphosphate 5-phosphatase A [Acipenser ruthenus]|uniref:Phosphatidylinositol 4,5-bisphosphate 5-phosphatase A n=1 Tax=Acipenser ruthenus TaxID=7906 RepID=A0A444V5L5_ACIRT|nr:Phosphatidylinositol 4,5-bisphosphate 5-phosphatase A [Acipenser ruthenus]